MIFIFQHQIIDVCLSMIESFRQKFTENLQKSHEIIPSLSGLSIDHVHFKMNRKLSDSLLLSKLHQRLSIYSNFLLDRIERHP